MYINEIKWAVFACKDRACVNGSTKINGENWNFPRYIDECNGSIKEAQIKIMGDIVKRMRKPL